jgi:hypothetical protein
VTRRRASTIRREDPELEAIVASLPGSAPAPQKPQQPAVSEFMHPKGIRADQERWVKETGRWGR